MTQHNQLKLTNRSYGLTHTLISVRANKVTITSYGSATEFVTQNYSTSA